METRHVANIGNRPGGRTPLFRSLAAGYPHATLPRMAARNPDLRQEPRVRLVFSAVLLTAFIARSAAADVTFHVRDRLAADEIEELTSLFIDGQLVRSFRLGDGDSDVTVPVTLLQSGAHDYGLCGHLWLKAADGSVIERVVDATGTIEDVEGRAFEAVASDDFTHFFLVETTTDRQPTTITPHQARACVPAVS